MYCAWYLNCTISVSFCYCLFRLLYSFVVSFSFLHGLQLILFYTSFGIWQFTDYTVKWTNTDAWCVHLSLSSFFLFTVNVTDVTDVLSFANKINKKKLYKFIWTIENSVLFYFIYTTPINKYNLISKPIYKKSSVNSNWFVFASIKIRIFKQWQKDNENEW